MASFNTYPIAPIPFTVGPTSHRVVSKALTPSQDVENITATILPLSGQAIFANEIISLVLTIPAGHELKQLIVLSKYDFGRGEIVFDGTGFMPGFSQSSTFSSVDRIVTLGIKKTTGWQDTVRIKVFAATDKGGILEWL
jgi:hypothetical protein